MLVRDLPIENLLRAQLDDKAYHALQLMDEFDVCELAVTDEEDNLIGLIKQETLFDTDEEATIGSFQHYLLKVSVNEKDHFLTAVEIAVVAQLSILPVINAQNKLVGTVASSHLLTAVADFMQLNEPGALIVLDLNVEQYSVSEICRLVESNDAQIVQFNTSKDKESGRVLVTLRVSRLEVSDIVATFQRYEYHVKYYFGEELYSNELKSNYENLMSYLNV